MSSDTTTHNPNRLLDAILKVGGDPADMPFWQACESGQFLVHRCKVCNRSYWPASRCVEHGDEAMVWVEASGRGTLHTYTIMYRSLLPAMKTKVPYVIGVVKLAEGPLYHTNIINCDHHELAVDMPLKVAMEPHESGLTLPMFSPANKV